MDMTDREFWRGDDAAYHIILSFDICSMKSNKSFNDLFLSAAITIKLLYGSMVSFKLETLKFQSLLQIEHPDTLSGQKTDSNLTYYWIAKTQCLSWTWNFEISEFIDIQITGQ